MTGLNLNLPASIYRYVDGMARKEGVSAEQNIAAAIAEMISTIATEDYLMERASRARRDEFESILNRPNEREP